LKIKNKFYSYMMNVAVKFIQNLKASLSKSTFNETELDIIFSTMNEVSNMSAFEIISLLDNTHIAILEAEKEMVQEDLDKLKKELFEEHV